MFQKIKIFFIVFILFFIACSTTNNTNSKYEIKHINTFLWQINSNTATVYLLGSIHVAKPDFYPLNDKIEQSYQKSDALVVEININNLDMKSMMKRIILPGRETLESKLSKKTYEKLKKIFEKNNIPETMFYKYKPWFAVMMITMMDVKNSGYDQNLGIDKYFLDKAKKDKKKIIELESAKQQFDIFDIDLKNYQDEFVKYTLEDSDNTIEMIDSLAAYWKQGNIKEMNKLINQPIAKDSSFKIINEVLITNRNKKMAKKIIDFLKTDKTYFVVVGAGHLIGDNGIIKLLSKKSKF